MQIAGTSLRPLEFWRSDVSFEQTKEFGASSLATLVRLGSGAVVHDVGPRPDDALILFESETCPHSRLVREALSELDLDALIKPCPKGEIENRQELAQYGQTQFPYLIDRAAGAQLGESHQIVEHLFARYGNGASVPLRMRGVFARQSSRLASQLRGGPQHYRRPKHRPELTLELWNYEGSPYCRLVRERLGELGLPYVSRNLARNSPRREAFKARYGKEQFPRLHDPNTSIGIFETDAILQYLQARYAAHLAIVDTEVSAHPA